MTPPTVFVVDDDAAIRKSLRLLVQSVNLPVETFESGQEFLDKIDPTRPGCLVLDLRMPGVSGTELQQRLAARRIALPIIFISAHGDLPSAVGAMRAGAVDFLEKPFRGQVLLDRIHQALRHDAQRRQTQQQNAETAARLALLSPPERDVLNLMTAGKPYKSIAKDLGVSYKAVEGRRARIMKKMQVETLPELLQRVLSHQLADRSATV